MAPLLAKPRATVPRTTPKLESGQTSTEEVYIKGKISSIKYNFSAEFGTATFNISDDGKAANEFIIYSTLYLNNEKYTAGDLLSVGDDVVILGKVTNYNGTLETASRALSLIHI